jgi:hypothetical protein
MPPAPPDQACQKRLGAVYDAFDQHNYKVGGWLVLLAIRSSRPRCVRVPTAADCALALRAQLHTLQAALKLCNAGIQKYPEAYAFQSLKAVALARSGKMEEAVEVGGCGCRG